MDPRKTNATRGYRQRESRRLQATLWQPEIPVKENEMSTEKVPVRGKLPWWGILLIVIGVLALIGFCCCGPLTYMFWPRYTAPINPPVVLPTVNAPTPVPPVPTTAPITIAPTSANCGDTTLQTLYLTVVNPGVTSQTQIGHPSAYAETHVSNVPVCVVLDVPDGYVGIVGGFTIDKQTDGVYRGFGPGHYEFVVTNGFGLITVQAWGKAEWDFRIQQTITYNWAHSHIDAGPIK